MVLYDAKIGSDKVCRHLHLQNGYVRCIADHRQDIQPGADEVVVELNGAVVSPGFINSHDHLEFNLYPRLGNRLYADYTEWGKDIHQTHAALIKATESIPVSLRIKWGLYKNLLGGFTTVVNHGKKIETQNDLLDVYQDCDCLHSPAFESGWRKKLNRLFHGNTPVVMHIGEGLSRNAHDEIYRVINSNYFSRRIVAVHGVAMDQQQASRFAALVWCPSSNFFLLGKTAAIEHLRDSVSIVFGTDSTLTSSWAAADHFHDALETGMVTESELTEMLTITPASVWNLSGKGKIAKGMKADILVKSNGRFFEKNPFDMVIQAGEVKTFSQPFNEQVSKLPLDDFDTINLQGQQIFVKKGLADLVSQLRAFPINLEIPFEIVQQNYA